MTIHEAARVHRLDAQSMQRALAKAGLAAVVLSPVIAVAAIYFWLDSRLTVYEQNTATGGLMAVIDKCGNPYEFEITTSGEWTPAEAMYVAKLEDIVDCTRGIRTPRTDADKSCWLKVFPTLGDDANKHLLEYLQQFGKDSAEVKASMQRRQVEIEILPGSTKSPDGRYRLQWRERERASGRDEIWSGNFVVSKIAATKKMVAEGNALGMRVESFTWQRDQSVK